MANRDVLAIGTSAGGVEALIFLAKRFSREFPAAVLITIHLPSHSRSVLDELLSNAGPLPAQFARNGEVARKGRIYIAPPDRHLLLDGEKVSLGEGPRENNARPAIDPMLRSTALCCSGRAIGVVLTGSLGDGASGLWAIRQAGGIAVVQDPKDAAFAEMPMTALNRAKPDHVVALADMPLLLEKLVHQPAGETRPLPRSIRYEVEVARTGIGNMEQMDAIGRRAVLACPDCGGVMWELDEEDLIRYRCHVGHTYTAEVMSVALDENLRRALASALRALEERVALARKLYRQAIAGGHRLLAETWADKSREFEREMDVIRASIRRMDRIAAADDLKEARAAE
ncbi:MAG: chemotaxis protein CheB [Hyphomicrobiales bacterium]|nr:chemotaxis protein CheB [Hyphomicrobiales bacterium]MBV9429774.1 chemotaxis protein CheB [Bradyrhizobiaceae bacterium]